MSVGSLEEALLETVGSATDGQVLDKKEEHFSGIEHSVGESTKSAEYSGGAEGFLFEPLSIDNWWTAIFKMIFGLVLIASWKYFLSIRRRYTYESICMYMCACACVCACTCLYSLLLITTSC